MASFRYLTSEELEQGLAHVLQSPENNGSLELIIKRPEVDQRVSVTEGRLEIEHGLVGDSWRSRGGDMTDGSADPDVQITIMNSRVAALVADDDSRWELAGDQLYLDLDLSGANLPPGTKLAIGDAIIEVTEPPHTGCRKFADRFGKDATVFVNSGLGRKQNFRGINARVVQAGDIKVGDVAQKLI